VNHRPKSFGAAFKDNLLDNLDNVNNFDTFALVGPSMTFTEILSRWNRGTLRGAQTRLARKLGLAPNTISQWVTGVSRPDEDLRPLLVKELSVGEEELNRLFSERRFPRSLREPAADAAEGAPLAVYGPIEEEPFPFDVETGVVEEFLPLRLSGKNRGAALRVKGGHWAELADDGDYLLVAVSTVGTEGKWVLLRGKDGCRLRRYKRGIGDVAGVVLGRYRRI
jgi:transcriptional regulator with XRE-family HTH domain